MGDTLLAPKEKENKIGFFTGSGIKTLGDIVGRRVALSSLAALGAGI